jgi:hypothetical protein
MTDTEREWINRRQFLDMLGISDSNERRQRREGRPWPPHLFIGGKVYYRRSAVEDWLRRQETLCMDQGDVAPTQPLANERAPEIDGQVGQAERNSLDAVSGDQVGDASV